jgi:hypothetical protein
MQTTNNCNNLLAVTDSISINKNIIDPNGNTNFPQTSIAVNPNPFDQHIGISGLDVATSYTIILYNSSGRKIRMVQVNGQTHVDIGSAMLQKGIYWLEVYDNTRNRRLGKITLLK